MKSGSRQAFGIIFIGPSGLGEAYTLDEFMQEYGGSLALGGFEMW